MMQLADLFAIYNGSNGDATKALYELLKGYGVAGDVATNLFRASKTSGRAKVYRGGLRGRGSYRVMAYDTKQWAMDNICSALAKDSLGMRWGWAIDINQPYHCHVLYIDLPTGQVSFHTDRRGAGPDYGAAWDGVRDAAAQRICSWIADVLRAPAPAELETADV